MKTRKNHRHRAYVYSVGRCDVLRELRISNERRTLYNMQHHGTRIFFGGMLREELTDKYDGPIP